MKSAKPSFPDDFPTGPCFPSTSQFFLGRLLREYEKCTSTLSSCEEGGVKGRENNFSKLVLKFYEEDFNLQSN